MAKSWMNTLKGYFSMMNQLEIEGNVSELESFFRGNEDAKRKSERIQRGRESLSYRNAKPLKCRTIIRNIQIVSEDKSLVNILLHNHLWKLYRMGYHFIEQEDEQYHQITLRELNGDWYIETDVILGQEENNAFRLQEVVEDDQEKDVDDVNMSFDHPGAYNRAKVKRYAELWWNRNNPSYPKFEVDCTNFVSQCLHAGGVAMEITAQRNKGWWVQGKTNWSFSWSVAHSLMNYLLGSNTKNGTRGKLKKSAKELLVGDVICYDWDGNGQFQHNTVVVAKDPNGMPLVNAHTINSRHRYWDYQDSYAWTKNTQYRFIHIKS